MKKTAVYVLTCLCGVPFLAGAQQAPAAGQDAQDQKPPVVIVKKSEVVRPFKKEVSPKAKEAAEQVLNLMKEVSDTLHGVKDQASADAAAVKIVEINKRGEALAKNAESVGSEMADAMDVHRPKLIPIYMLLQEDSIRLKRAEFFGSRALKNVLSNLHKTEAVPAKKAPAGK